jgi:hypothetical protein
MNKFALGCGVEDVLFVVVAALAVAAATIVSSACSKLSIKATNVYQRRADLIPNLVNTVQARRFEKSTHGSDKRAWHVGRVQTQIDPNKAPRRQRSRKFQAAQRS